MLILLFVIILSIYNYLVSYKTSVSTKCWCTYDTISVRLEPYSNNSVLLEETGIYLRPCIQLRPDMF